MKLGLALILVLGLGFLSGYAVKGRARSSNGSKVGNLLRGLDPHANEGLRWRRVTGSEGADAIGDDLSALGYLQGYSAATDRAGVTRHDATRAWQGANLCVSGHGSTATLMGMDGDVLHEWSLDLADVCPEVFDPEIDASLFFRRARMCPDGSLLVVFDYRALVKIGPDSEVLWKRCEPYHHDIALGADGRVFAIARSNGFLKPPLDKIPILDDEIHVLSPEGELKQRLSVLDVMVNSEFSSVASRITDGIELHRSGDVFHTNSIRLVPETSSPSAPGFAAGNVILSLRNLDTLAVVDLAKGQATWAFTGGWHAQHDAVVLEDGNVLLFDNMGLILKDTEHKSRVLEFDPLRAGIAWSHDGWPDAGFGSTRCGSVQRLSNGNTLIIVTEEGRAFEVTSDGETVWEYWNPHRAGDDEELIASLFDVVRYGAEETRWLEAR